MALALPSARARTSGGVHILGHRGARGLRVENTLASFRAALAYPIAGVELDVLLSADGIPVVWHDPVLLAQKLGPDAQHLAGRNIADVTAAELARLDVGTAVLAEFPRQQPAPGGIERLTTILELVLDHPSRPWVLLEIKAAPGVPAQRTTAAVIAALETMIRPGRTRQDIYRRIVVESFDWRVVQECGRCAPELPRAALAVEPGGVVHSPTVFDGSPWLGSIELRDYADMLEAVAALGVQAVAPFGLGILAKEDPGAWVQRAHDLGLAVLAWTINEPDHLRRLVEIGVDGVVTDDPDIALRTLDPQRWHQWESASSS